MLTTKKIINVCVQLGIAFPAAFALIYSAGVMVINIVCLVVLFGLGKFLLSPLFQPKS